MKMIHIIQERQVLATPDYLAITVTMASGRAWHFRKMTATMKVHAMSTPTGGSAAFPGEYRVARAAAERAS